MILLIFNKDIQKQHFPPNRVTSKVTSVVIICSVVSIESHKKLINKIYSGSSEVWSGRGSHTSALSVREFLQWLEHSIRQLVKYQIPKSFERCKNNFQRHGIVLFIKQRIFKKC